MSYQYDTGKHRVAPGRWVVDTAVTTPVTDPSSRAVLRRANRRLLWRKLGADAEFGMLCAFLIIVVALAIIGLGVGS